MMNNGAKLLELELLNGDRIVGRMNPSKMYGMVQKTRTKLRLCRSFPFFLYGTHTVYSVQVQGYVRDKQQPG